MGRAAPALSSPRPAELRRASRAPRLPPAASARAHARRRGGTAGMAAERRRVQQRRGGLLGPGGGDRDRSRPGGVLPGLPRAPAALPDAAFAGVSAPPRRGLRALRRGRAGRRDRLPGLPAGQASLRAEDGAARGVADGADALPRGGLAAGAAGRADDALRHAHAGPLRALPDDPRTPVALRRRCGHGADVPLEGDEHRAPRRCLRVPGTDAGARVCGCATWRWRWG